MKPITTRYRMFIISLFYSSFDLINMFHYTVGPYMVLEFCEVGQLNSWLQQQKNKANEETSEQLCRICYGICKGMLHLESRKVTCTIHNDSCLCS